MHASPPGPGSATDPAPAVASHRDLSPAARRALAEAAERRARLERDVGAGPPKELNGRNGPEPVRYGDWEVKGIASDF